MIRPSRGPRPHSSIIIATCLILLAAVGDSTPVSAQSIREDFYATNGTVRTTALDGNVLYVGGEFTEVAYATGGVAATDPSTGVRVPGFPKVVGTVNVIVSDGAGGWYLGGWFTHIDRIPRSNLAHVDASHQVTAWDPGADGGIEALVVSGTTIYVGGRFSSIGGQPRIGIAALDAETGLATAWNPEARTTTSFPGHGLVFTIAVSGSTVYVGGSFDQIGGQPRLNIAALDAGTDTNNATTWAPDANDNVNALAVSGTTVYAGGEFTTIGGQARNRIAALDATINTANATAWNPNLTAAADWSTVVYALGISGNLVYVGGYFTQIGGQSRNCIAALDRTIDSNNATPWNPDAGTGDKVIWDLLVHGNTVYVTGFFTAIGGQPRNGVAALDATVATNNATPWNPRPNGRVYALGSDGTMVVIGGTFSAINGVPRNGIAAFDVSTGLPTAWNPNAAGVVHAIVPNGSTVYAGGSFTHIGGQPRSNLAALDAGTNTNNAIPWHPNAATVGTVYALALKGSTLYAGGTFQLMGGEPRNRIGAVNAVTGNPNFWNPSPSRQDGGPVVINALAVSGNRVYVGGYFNQIGGQSHNHIAAVDAGAGFSTGWSPSANDQVNALAVNDDGTIVYAGGNFTSIGGASRQRIAALDATVNVNNATPWNPGSNLRVFTLAFRDETVYAGGAFTTIGGAARDYVAALDATGAGVATPWNPDPSSNVFSLSVNGTSAFLGGAFGSIDNLPQTFLAATGNGLADIPDPMAEGARLKLLPNQPNPFRESTRIRFSLAGSEHVTLEVFDLAGRLVATPLVESRLEPGDHSIPFHGDHLVPGVYLYRLQVGDRAARGKLVIAR